MNRRVRKPVAPESLRKIAEFLRIAHDLPKIAAEIEHAAEDLEYYRGSTERLHREIAALRSQLEHPDVPRR